jgi:hypothetical protein
MTTVPNPLPFPNLYEFIRVLLIGSPSENLQELSGAFDHLLLWFILWLLIRHFLRACWYGE